MYTHWFKVNMSTAVSWVPRASLINVTNSSLRSDFSTPGRSKPLEGYSVTVAGLQMVWVISCGLVLFRVHRRGWSFLWNCISLWVPGTLKRVEEMHKNLRDCCNVMVEPKNRPLILLQPGVPSMLDWNHLLLRLGNAQTSSTLGLGVLI